MFQITTVIKKLERFFLAITFAEANLKEVALSFFQGNRFGRRVSLEKKKRPSRGQRPHLRL